ncbi:Transposase [hydrothermal vent metagenome]|uniref:Transposase n=1 Tax=hydrothermal vent metagenome TaxID=652676 RepID=A0A3B0TD06_9ZZZZ
MRDRIRNPHGLDRYTEFMTLPKAGAPAVLAEARDKFPWLRHIFADGGYAGEKLRRALMKISDWTIEIIKRSDDVAGFEVLPRRWVVEPIPDLVEDRLFAWPGRSRRLAKDWERSLESAIAWLFIAYIHILTRRLARHCG